MSRQIQSASPPPKLVQKSTPKTKAPKQKSSLPKPTESGTTGKPDDSLLYPNATRKHPLAECERCPLYERGTYVPTKFPTAPSNGIAFIGESPGTQEKRKGEPFVGPSGRLLREACQIKDINVDGALLTNGALCNYKDEDKASLPGAISACRGRLLSELNDTGIETAVTLGNAAVSSLLNTKTGITKLRGGGAKESDYAELSVIPTFHPAACLRNQAQFPLFLEDLGKVSPAEATWIEPTYHVVTDVRKALSVLSGANRCYPYVVDVETGKEKEQQYSRTTNLLCVGIGSTKPSHNNIVLVIGRPAIYEPTVQDALISLLADTGVICQNGKFDTYILHGINHVERDLYLVADTMLQSYSLNETPGTHSLGYMGVEYLGTPDWKDVIKPYLVAPKDPPEIRQPALEYVQEALKDGPELRAEILNWCPDDIPKAAISRAANELQVREYKDADADYRPHQIRWSLDPTKSSQIATPEADGSYASIPPDILHRYNAFDVQVTRQLHEFFSRRQEEEGLVEFNKHLMVMSNALMRVERNGLQVDYQFNDTLYKQFTDYIDELKKVFPEGLNPGSPKQLRAFIWQTYGYQLDGTGEEVIVSLQNDPKTDEDFRQFCADLLEYRKWTKLRSTYVNSIRTQAIENGGRVLPTFKIDQATTGRLASKNPNVQNMPRQFDIKRQFVPSASDRVFIHADYSQLELRVITWLARDEGMRTLFNDPERDLFDELTQTVYSMSKDEFDELKVTNPTLIKERRVIVKAFAYGIILDRSAAGIAMDPNLNLSIAEATTTMEVFNKQIPGIIEFQKTVKQDVLDGKDLVNIFGRHRRFHLITNQNKAELLRQAVAFYPQSTASDICVTALSRLPRYMDPRNIIHDAILLECPRDEAQEQGALLVKTMIDTAEEVTGGYVKFDVDYDIGDNWQDLVKASKWQPTM